MQLNDTHPALSILELLRYLVDSENIEMKLAWSIVTNTFSYTNHTVLPEALEKWEVGMFGALLPRHLELLYLINHYWLEKVRTMFPDDANKLKYFSIIEEGDVKMIKMSHLSIIGSHKVNGVARVHTEILKSRIFKEFYEIEPQKFINITNGVTPRRWIHAANPDLSKFYTDQLASSEWLINMELLKTLSDHKNDPSF